MLSWIIYYTMSCFPFMTSSYSSIFIPKAVPFEGLLQVPASRLAPGLTTFDRAARPKWESNQVLNGIAILFQRYCITLLVSLLNASSSATTIKPSDMVPIYTKIVCNVGFSGCPLHSRALMPNTEAKKDSGKKMMVNMVNIMMERPWSAATCV